MKKLLIGLLLSLPSLAKSNLIKVAVIDTGLDVAHSDAPICKNGLVDFTGEGIIDVVGHGSHISDLIDQYAKDQVRTVDYYTFSNKVFNKDLSYCQIILKYYTESAIGEVNLMRSIKAEQYALEHGATIINYSGGGGTFDQTEYNIVEHILNKGIIFVAAAGNDSQELFFNVYKQKGYSYYPAQYDNRVIVVGNRMPDGTYGPRTNYGERVNQVEMGTSRLSKCAHNTYCYFTGTSQSTAVHTGKIIRNMLKGKNNEE